MWGADHAAIYYIFTELKHAGSHRSVEWNDIELPFILNARLQLEVKKKR